MQKGSDRSNIGYVIAEARELTHILVDWKVTLVKEHCIPVANELAKLVRKNSHTIVWLVQTLVCYGPASYWL